MSSWEILGDRKGAWRGLLMAAAIVGYAVLAGLRCGAAAKQQSMETVLGAMSGEQRRSNFEDSAQVLEHHLDWVDELYSVTRSHPILLKRLLQQASRDLKDPQLAATAAELLIQEPPSIEQVLKSTVDAAKGNPDARHAMDRAVAARAEPVADIITDQADTVEAMVHGLLAVASRKPAAKKALLAAVQREAPAIVDFAASDPKLLAAMARPVLAAAWKDRDALTKLLKELKIL